jgi:hypothetical protein
MIRYECLELLAPLITGHLIVTSQSGQRIEWNNLLNHDGNLLVGSMGKSSFLNPTEVSFWLFSIWRHWPMSTRLI